MSNHTELIELAGATDNHKVVIYPSWKRLFSLIFLALILVVTVALIVNTTGLVVTPLKYAFLAACIVAIVALVVVTLLDTISMRNVSYTFTTNDVSIHRGNKIQTVAFSDLASVELEGRYTQLVSGGQVGHLILKRLDGDVVKLKDVPNIDLAAHCVLVRRQDLVKLKE